MGLGHHGDLPDLLAGLVVGHVNDGDGAAGDVAVLVQGQIVTGDLPGGVAHAGDGHFALLVVDGDMDMGHLEHVHLGVVLQDLRGGVRAALLVKFAYHAHVGGDHDDVGLIADLGDGLLHAVADGGIGAVLNAFLAAVPGGDVGGGDADDGQLDAAALDDGPALAGNILAPGVKDVGGQDGELRLPHDLEHIGNAVVELVVAQGHGVELHVVHGGQDRMGLVGGLVVDLVDHDGPLDVVSGVDEEGIGILLPYLLDVGIEAGHAVIVGLLVILVAIAPDACVEIGGAKDRDMGLVFCSGSLAFRSHRGGQQGDCHHQSQQDGEKLS